MKKKTAGERKRTVTVTLGPRTLELLEALLAEMEKPNPGMSFDLTTAARVVMATGMAEYCKHYGMAVDKSWSNTFQ
jgi:hypothetical protein